MDVSFYLIGNEDGPNYGDIPYDSAEAAQESADEFGGIVWRVHATVTSSEPA